MFLVDKYSPNTISDSKFHNSLLTKINYLATNDSIPHILICGPPGSGKKTLIRLLLEMIYDKDINDVVDTVYKVTGSGNKATDVIVKQSNYHIVIEPNNNNFDRYLIQDIVKEYAKKNSLNIFKTRKIFRTVLINNIDNLSYYAQTSLRRTMEKYSTTCRFIMWCASSTRVITPLISRCIYFTLNSPTDSELFRYMLDICCKEQLNLTLDDYSNILKNVNGNIKEALWHLELIRIGYTKQNIYYFTIDLICQLVISHNFNQLNTQIKVKDDKRLFIREILYSMLITNISGTKMFIDICNKLCDNNDVPDECKYRIIYYMAYYEHNFVKCRRSIMHIEAAIIKIMKTFYKYALQHQEYILIFQKYNIKVFPEEDTKPKVNRLKRVIKKN